MGRLGLVGVRVMPSTGGGLDKCKIAKCKYWSRPRAIFLLRRPPGGAGVEHELWGSSKGGRFVVENARIFGCWSSSSISRYVERFSLVRNRFHSPLCRTGFILVTAF